MNFKRRRPRRWVRCVMCTPGRAGNSLRGAPRRTLLRFAPIGLLALLASCRGADARPDEFSLEVGHGDYDGQVEGRSMDGGGEWASVGWTWHLNPVTPPARAAAALGPVAEPEAAPPTEAQPEATAESVGEALAVPAPAGGLSTRATLAAALAGCAAAAVGIFYRKPLQAGLLAAVRWAWSWLGRALRALRPAAKRGRR